VCEGEYARGLERILSNYLTNLHAGKQPAVWVSGFYGSGKSHLLRVLEYLWLDLRLPSGGSARSVVTLPDTIRDDLKELTTASKRLGGLWSAAGTLGAGKGDAVRLAFLSILFDAAGLPEQYPLARFVLWARENRYLDSVKEAVAVTGKAFEKEVRDLYVSPIIAKALLAADPTLGGDVESVRNKLIKQFPPTSKDISDNDLFDAIDDVLRINSSDPKRLPVTLVVLDELQQYIGDDGDRALAVQNIVEGCSARFNSQLLIVGAGQSALVATPTLQKLTDRFPIAVALSDTDVQTVVREVVLRKKPEEIAPLRATLDAVSGEIDRELGGTQLAPKSSDKNDLVSDYPLLPTRRRFWDLALRAIDRAGKAGVLRTQLKIVHEAVRHVADDPVGHVIGGDFVYEQQSVGMQQTGVLLKEIDELIRGLKREGADGLLKSRICALVFLITQIPARTIGGDTGLKATAPFLADLLVEDLADDGARLRKQLPELLSALVDEGHLMQIDDEYRLQTEEGADWEKDYRSRVPAIKDDAARMNQLRSERLIEAFDGVLSGLKLTQGTSKTPRKLSTHWGQAEPPTAGGDVPVWVRDEWSVSESAVKKSAAEAGSESPIVYVFLPKPSRDEIRETLASHAAAQDTVQQRPTPQTDEGRAAQRAMQTRVTLEGERLTRQFADVIANSRIFQGGGSEVTMSTPRDAIETAANRSLVRLFPRFKDADNLNWGKVVEKARDGAPDALEAVGHHGEPLGNVVCKEIFHAITAGGTKGSELHKRFEAPKYGWPRDAINGAVLVLLAANNIRAAQDGKLVRGPKELPPTQIGKVTLYKEEDPPTTPQRIAVRGLFAAANIPYESGQEGAQIPALLQRLKEVAARAGGSPPLPEPGDASHTDALLALGGNQQFRAVADDEKRLRSDFDKWKSNEQKRQARETEWAELQRLVRHAEGLDITSRVDPGIKAIQEGRQLLDNPDPVKPLLDQVANALRSKVEDLRKRLEAAQAAAVNDLEASGDWTKLAGSRRESILGQAKLASVPPLEISSNSGLLETLDASPIAGWEDRINLVPTRRDQARQAAAKLLEPESVSITPPSATLRTEPELDAYLEGVRTQVLPHLRAKKTVII
jgi:hypothetical protein